MKFETVTNLASKAAPVTPFASGIGLPWLMRWEGEIKLIVGIIGCLTTLVWVGFNIWWKLKFEKPKGRKYENND